jgi:hypothetical protein
VNEFKPLPHGGPRDVSHISHAAARAAAAATAAAAQPAQPAARLQRPQAALGRPVQVDPTKPTLKAPGTKHSKPSYDEPPSKVSFKFNLRRYISAPRAPPSIQRIAPEAYPAVVELQAGA